MGSILDNNDLALVTQLGVFKLSEVGAGVKVRGMKLLFIKL